MAMDLGIEFGTVQSWDGRSGEIVLNNGEIVYFNYASFKEVKIEYAKSETLGSLSFLSWKKRSFPKDLPELRVGEGILVLWEKLTRGLFATDWTVLEANKEAVMEALTSVPVYRVMRVVFNLHECARPEIVKDICCFYPPAVKVEHYPYGRDAVMVSVPFLFFKGDGSWQPVCETAERVIEKEKKGINIH